MASLPEKESFEKRKEEEEEKEIEKKLSINKLPVVPEKVTECINFCISSGEFPNDLKLAEVVTIFKKNDNITPNFPFNPLK